MPEVQETELPGLGVRYDFETRAGDRLAVLLRRTGRRELFLYAADDPDSCVASVRLEPDDSHTLVELLGAARVVEHLAALQQEIEGLAIDWIAAASGADWSGKTLGEAAVHSTTGVSVIALLRAGKAIPAPGATETIEVGDTVIALGSPEGLALVAAHLRAT